MKRTGRSAAFRGLLLPRAPTSAATAVRELLEGEEQKSLPQPPPLPRRLPATATYSRGRSLICNQTLEHAVTPSHTYHHMCRSVLYETCCPSAATSVHRASFAPLAPLCPLSPAPPHPPLCPPLQPIAALLPYSAWLLPHSARLLTVQLAQEAHGMFREPTHKVKGERKKKNFHIYKIK